MAADDHQASTMRTQLSRACAELERRLRSGEACTAEDCLRAEPDLAADVDFALELVYTEFATRESMGQVLDRGELFRRFPQWRDGLERVLKVHDVLVDRQNPALTSISPAKLQALLQAKYTLLEKLVE